MFDKNDVDDILQRVKDNIYVLRQCAKSTPYSLRACQALIDLALERTAIILRESDSTEHRAFAIKQRVCQWHSHEVLNDLQVSDTAP